MSISSSKNISKLSMHESPVMYDSAKRVERMFYSVPVLRILKAQTKKPPWIALLMIRLSGETKKWLKHLIAAEN